MSLSFYKSTPAGGNYLIGGSLIIHLPLPNVIGDVVTSDIPFVPFPVPDNTVGVASGNASHAPGGNKVGAFLVLSPLPSTENFVEGRKEELVPFGVLCA